MCKEKHKNAHFCLQLFKKSPSVNALSNVGYTYFIRFKDLQNNTKRGYGGRNQYLTLKANPTAGVPSLGTIMGSMERENSLTFTS